MAYWSTASRPTHGDDTERIDIMHTSQNLSSANLLRRARAHATLTPAERALLRLGEGLLCAGLVAALPVVAEALARQSVDWSAVGRAALAAAATAILLALNKYLNAHSDPPLTEGQASSATAS
jgi:hypothetical protein